jgi:hypothetical protein
MNPINRPVTIATAHIIVFMVPRPAFLGVSR